MLEVRVFGFTRIDEIHFDETNTNLLGVGGIDFPTAPTTWYRQTPAG